MKRTSQNRRNAIVLTFLSLTLVSGIARAARTEENNPAVMFNGSWTSVTDPLASGGSYMMSSTAGNTVTFQFAGDSLVLYRYLSTAGGQATVTIDNNAWGMISFASAQTAEQAPAVLDHLGTGAHTIVLTVAAPFGGGAAGPVTVDAFEFPTTFTAVPNQSMGLVTINQIRTQAGLPVASLSAALDLAAQAHASYLANNNAGGHNETAGTPGFTGLDPNARALFYGYDNAGFEVANPGGDTPDAVTGEWMATVYHRTSFLTYNLVDIGCGTAMTGQNGGGVVDFGYKRGTSPASRLILTWPPNNQTSVPLSFSNESPSPVPTVADLSTLGYPISLHIAQPANVTMGTDTLPVAYSLTGPNNQQIMVSYVDRNNNPGANQGGSLGDDYFMVPLQALTPNTTYTANIAGVDTQGHQFNQTWTFTTVDGAAIQNPLVVQTPTDTQIIWSTAGPVMTTTVQYGPTTTYGTTVTPTVLGTNAYVADLRGLAGGTYHYQITATDPAGVVMTSPDLTFTAPNIPAATVSGDYIFPQPGGVAYAGWHTFGAVMTAQIQYGTTTAYGTTVSGVPDTTMPPNYYFAVLSGLTTGSTYHYQFTATDAQGNTLTTADMTFIAQ